MTQSVSTLKHLWSATPPTARWLLIGGIIMTLALALIIGAHHTSPDPNPIFYGDDLMQLAQGLASIDAGHRTAVDDLSVKRLRFLLDSLHEASGVDRKDIAALMAFAHKELRDQYGSDDSVLEFMEALCEPKTLSVISYNRNGGKQALVEYVAMVIVMVGLDRRMRP